MTAKLRYVTCQLPDQLERAVIEFEDWFGDLIQKKYDNLNALIKKHLPTAKSELNKQIALREQLLQGAPNGLSSLDAVEKATGLTNPARDPQSEEAARTDEMKLGSAQIALIKGKPFKLLPGTRISDLRYVWEAVSGNYQAFITMVNAVTSLPTGTPIFLMANPVSGRFPYINKNMNDVESISGYHKSIFKHRLLWNGVPETTASNNSKMTSYGFTDDQLTNVFAGEQPNEDFDFMGQLRVITTFIKNLTFLLALPQSDSRRQPNWVNEIEVTEYLVNQFLDWRYAYNTTSSNIDSAFWRDFKYSLTEDEMKELFEQRLDVTNMQVPTTFDDLQTLFSDALTTGGENSKINSYMLKSKASRELGEKGKKLANILAQLVTAVANAARADQPVRAAKLDKMVLYITGGEPIVPEKVTMSANELKSIVNNGANISAGELKSAVDALGKNEDGTVNEIFALSLQSNLYTSDFINTYGIATSDGTDVGIANKVSQGFTSKETPSMLLARRVNFNKAGLSCRGTEEIQTSSPSGESQTSVTDTQTGEVIGTKPNDLSKNTKKMPKTGLPSNTDPSSVEDKFAAKDRRSVDSADGVELNQVKGSFELNCIPTWFDEFGKQLEAARKKFEAMLVYVIEMIKEIILYIQDKIDTYIIMFQLVMDEVFAKLEKLLTIDIGFTGKFGMENSLIKCSWNLDLGLKIDLLSLLLALLKPFFDLIGEILTDFLNAWSDFITEIFCIPINWLDKMLGNVSAFLSYIGCTVKDIQLPDAILDLLQLLQGTFSLRSLVLRQANDDWLDMSLGLKKQGNDWQGLSQFAAICNSPAAGNVAQGMVDSVALSVSDIPTSSSIGEAVFKNAVATLV